MDEDCGKLRMARFTRFSNHTDFTKEETERLLALGAMPVGLGRQRLRVETASVAMLATLMLLGDSLS